MPRSAAMRVGGAAVAMVVVAETAAWLLQPREEIPDPVPVSERDYFSPAELDRAHDYSSGQRLLGLAGIAIEGAVLVVVAVNPPRPVSRSSACLTGRGGLTATTTSTAPSIAIPARPSRRWPLE